MGASAFRLKNAPIIEAIIDIDCDMPPEFELAALEDQSREAFGERYPTLRKQYLEEYRLEPVADQASKVSSVPRKVQALRLFQEDRKQLVQVRVRGFSFNRLAPYAGLDEYLPEIERTWRLFVKIAAPIEVRAVCLRYINRILLPLADGRVDLERYLTVSPRLPDEEKLDLASFLDQHQAVEKATGHQINTLLASQPPENGKLPIIFDNGVTSIGKESPENWTWIHENIQSLRDLKNRVFRDTLTPRCLEQFQ